MSDDPKHYTASIIRARSRNRREESQDMRVTTPLIALLLATLPGIGGCQDVLKPKLNPNPQHVVRIVGRVPTSIEIELNASYAITGKDEMCKPSVAQQWGTAGIGNYFRSEELEIKRKSDSYQATFVVDKYLPGPCQWRIWRVSGGARRKDGDRSWAYVSRPMITGLSFYDPDHKVGCASGNTAKCEIESNGLDVPVVVPCGMFLYDKPLPGAQPGTIIPPDDKPTFMCPLETKVKNDFKQTHLLSKDTKQVQIDFYGLEMEADPTVRSSSTGGMR